MIWPGIHIHAYALVGLGAGLLFAGCSPSGGASRGGGEGQEDRVAPVEVAMVERRSLELQRTFSGALEAEAKVEVSAKVGGRIHRLHVDLADAVERGQVVAELDAAEFIQEVQQAEAELAVQQAMLRQAENAYEISGRENERIRLLQERGIASEAEFDISQADLLQRQGQVQVALAEVRRAEAALATARIRHNYTRVTADWSEEDSLRRVAERLVDEGQMVSANQPMFRVVQMDPIIAVITVTERDYGQLRPDLEARLQTDALPGETFRGRVVRVSPVFQASSRQARVEIELPNADNRLKPGMFVRATLTFRRVEEALAVPEEALTRRREKEGVFVLDAVGTRVRWVPVTAGIRSGGWVELREGEVTGRVVTLGQHLIEDGSAVVIAEPLLSRPSL